MSHNWIVCYFAMALELSENIINLFVSLDFFKECLLHRFNRKFNEQLLRWEWKDQGIGQWTNPADHCTIMMDLHFSYRPTGYLTRNIVISLFNGPPSETKEYVWHYDNKFTRNGKAITYDEFESEIVNFIQ